MKAFLFFLGLTIILFIGLFFLQASTRSDGKLHIVFCDVGQGDAVLIRTPSGSDILFDGGPNKKVLTCLSDHLPFWDRDIEMIFLSHPHADHLIGLLDVIDRYSINYFAREDLDNDTDEYKMLLKKVKATGAGQKLVHAGDRLKLSDGLTITAVGPTKEFLERTRGDGIINSKEFASLILHVKYKQFDVLLTGDSQSGQMEEAVRSGMGKIEVLHVPHHGSKTGLNSVVVDGLKPKVAVISVGKNNYGHPSKEAMDLLTNEGVKILRTDREGDVEIVTDGVSWEIR